MSEAQHTHSTRPHAIIRDIDSIVYCFCLKSFVHLSTVHGSVVLFVPFANLHKTRLNT